MISWRCFSSSFKGADDQYEVSVPWILRRSLSSTNQQPSRSGLIRVEMTLSQNPKMGEEYKKIVRDQLKEGIEKVVPKTTT